MSQEKSEATQPNGFPFTVFAFGTGESSTMKEKTIISHFSEACTSPYRVLEGPSLSGRQVGPNASNAVNQIIENLHKCPDQDKYVVNLTGLSRGAITCIRIANLLKSETERLAYSTNPEDKQLHEKLSKLELNIFNLDPVTGMGEKKNLKSRIIPDNVKNYAAILQLDEMRRDFKPQDMTRTIIESPEKTHVSMLPLYGNHTDSVKIKNVKMQSTAQIAQTALYTFLTKNGTTFQDNKMPAIAISKKVTLEEPLPEVDINNKEILFKLFRKQHDEKNAYLEYGQRHKLADSAMFRKPRSINDHTEYYVTDSNFFVNQLERELFKINYPRTFNYLFEKNSTDPYFASHSSNKSDVISELQTLQTEHNSLFEQLKERGVSVNGSEITIGDPQGAPNLESCRMVMQIYPHLLPEELTPEIAKARSSVIDLKDEIISATFRYERAKSLFSTFEKRSQSDRAEKIRKEVCEIVSDGDDNKEERLFGILNQHVTHLRHAKSSSTLVDMLEAIPRKHDKLSPTHLSLSLTTELLAGLIHASLSLVKNTIYFVGSLGFVGGYGLSMIGTFLEDFGRRMNESIGAIGRNPLKLLASAVATFVQAIGFVFKHHFGLKPLTEAVTAGIRDFRDERVARIRCNEFKQTVSYMKQEGNSTDTESLSSDDSTDSENSTNSQTTNGPK